MRKVIYSMGVSLDGFIEGPDGKFDWAFPDTELHQYFNDVERETGVHLYGRGLYETMRFATIPTRERHMKQDSTNHEQNDALPKIGAPATRALTDAGYTRLSQLSDVSAADLLKLHGVGTKAIQILREALAQKGLKFKGD